MALVRDPRLLNDSRPRWTDPTLVLFSLSGERPMLEGGGLRRGSRPTPLHVSLSISGLNCRPRTPAVVRPSLYGPHGVPPAAPASVGVWVNPLLSLVGPSFGSHSSKSSAPGCALLSACVANRCHADARGSGGAASGPPFALGRSTPAPSRAASPPVCALSRLLHACASRGGRARRRRALVPAFRNFPRRGTTREGEGKEGPT